MYVRDLGGNEYACQATITQPQELNGNRSLTATILPSKVNKVFIDDIAEMWEIVDHDDVVHKIVYAKRSAIGDLPTVEITATPVFFDKFDTSRVERLVDEHMTAHAFFNFVFNEPDFSGNSSGFNFVLVDSFTAIQWEGLGGGETRLEMFKRGLNRYKAEFRIVGNTVYLEKLIGRDTQFMYRYRLNASNIVQETDATAFYTYAKGYGDYEDGEDGGWESAKLVREYTSPLAQIPQIGIRHAPPIKNGNITTKETMDAQLKTLVDESIKISVSATIHDLRKQGYELAQPELGDRVFLIDERIGLNEEVRVVNTIPTKNWKGEVTDLQLTFGSEGITKRYQSNLNTAVDRINDIFDGRKKIEMSFLDERVQEISNIINGNVDSVFKYTPNGVIGWNGDDPNYMTRYVGDAIGFSRDGGKTYNTAMSADLGIVADYITTGTLRSIVVDSVEIYGSSIYGSEFISEVSSNEYTRIRGAYIDSRGTHDRVWRGRRETIDVSLRMEKGYFRARDHTHDWSLYLSGWGLSTYRDGTGNDDASGYIEFHSPDYSPTGSYSGLTIGSLAGRVAIETDDSRIYLNTGGAYVFVGDMRDNLYPILASNYSTSSSEASLAGASSRLLARPKENEALEIIKGIDLMRYTNDEYPVYKPVGDSAVTSNDVTDINNVGFYALKAIQEIARELEVLKRESS